MANFNLFYTTWTPRMLSILRLITGFLFMAHGTQKLFSYPLPSHTPGTFMLFTGALEFGGGLLILFGLFTRPAAFILSGQMAVAYFTVHTAQGFFPMVNKGEPAVLFCFVFLFLAVAGGGAWSFDNLLRRNKYADNFTAA